VVIDVLDNDSDVDGDPLAVESVTQPVNGTVVNNGTDVAYTPDPNYNGADSFSYVVTDGVFTDTAVVSVTVTPMPDPPEADDDVATTAEDTPVTIDVLGNDSDADGDPLSVESVTQPFNGTVVNNGADVTYTPDPDYNGADSFSYVVSDGVFTDTAVVSVTVAPVVTACELYPIALNVETLDGVQVGEEIEDIYNGGGPGNFGWLSWTGNPSVPTLVQSLTPPGDSYTYVNPYDPADSTLSVGDWVYGKPGVSNSKPVRDALDTLKDYVITVPVWGLADAQGGNLKYHIAGFADIQITSYQLSGRDRISAIFLGYRVCGEQCEEALPVDLLYVLDVSGSMDGAYHGMGTKLGAAKQAILTLSKWVGLQDNGSRVALLTFQGDGQGHGYPPIYPTDIQLVSEFTTDTVAFEAIVTGIDASGSTPTAAALEEVADWLPGAVDADHQMVVVLISDGVPTVDLDLHGFADQHVQTISLYDFYGEFRTPDEVRSSGWYYGAYGERAGEPLADTMLGIEHLKTEMPDAVVHTIAVQAEYGGIFNDDVLQYVAAHGGGEFFTAWDTLELVNALQQAYVNSVCGSDSGSGVPEADDDSATTEEDTVVTVDVLGNDSDVDGDTLSVDSVTQGAHGSVVNNGADVTYTPNVDYCGGDSFDYVVTDGVLTDMATVVVSVTCVNDAPEAEGDTVTMAVDEAITIDVLANDGDVDGDSLSVDSVVQGSHGSVVNNGMDVTYTPDVGYSGADSFTYVVTDGVLTDMATVSVIVSPTAASLACLHASEFIDVRDRAVVMADVCGGRYLKLGADARIEGDVIVDGNAFLRSRARVTGDVTLAGSLREQTDVVIDGTLEERATVTLPNIPVKDVSYGAHSVTVKNGQHETWAPGDYRDGKVRARGSVVFTAGTYNFRRLEIEPNAELILDTTGGEIVVNVDRQLEFGDRSLITAEGDGTVTFYTNSGRTLRIGTDVTFQGAIVAPYARVHVFSRAEVNCCIAARRIVIAPDTTMNPSRGEGATVGWPNSMMAAEEPGNSLTKVGMVDLSYLSMAMAVGLFLQKNRAGLRKHGARRKKKS
jgi:hypothetical protein